MYRFYFLEKVILKLVILGFLKIFEVVFISRIEFWFRGSGLNFILSRLVFIKSWL